MTTPFVWDGSNLGTFEADIIKLTESFGSLRYAVLAISGYEQLVILTKYTNVLCCMFDEMKTLFGIIKTGTHVITIDKEKYIIYHAVTSLGQVSYDRDIGDVIVINKDSCNINCDGNDDIGNDDIIDGIRKLLAFRDLVGVSPNIESDIKIRKSSTHFVYPVSFHDRYNYDFEKHVYNFNQRPLGERMVNKWFSKMTVSETVCDMLKEKYGLDLSDHDRVTETLVHIKNEINQIIKRIAKNHEWVYNHVCSKLSQRVYGCIS